MLEKLAEKDQLWREIAFKICRDRNLADDLVNEMYLRRYENDRGQELTDYYIICTIQSIYLNNKKTNKLIPVEEIRTDKYINGRFEPNDYESNILEKAKKLPYYKRELLELNYDYSLREIQKEFNINYGYVHKAIQEARKEILGSEINKYKNSRLKYKKMKSYGFGDTIEKLTKKTGIKRLVDSLTTDCGCEERKEYLNNLWKYKLKPKCLTDDEINSYNSFVKSRKLHLIGNGKARGKLSRDEIKFVYDFFGLVFNVSSEIPSCTSCSGTVSRIVDMIYKLDTVFVNSISEKPKKGRPKNV